MSIPFGHYRLERWLARGGTANIFLATYTGALGFEREIALKVILPEYARHWGFISMFLDEARLAARLSHPNIVQVHDLGEAGGYFYLAMELVPGSSLARMTARLKREERQFPLGVALYIAECILEALHHAHLRRARSGAPLNIVHRDVNPQNILLGEDGEVKLADFGVARASINLSRTSSGVVKGKYSHMAPEQCLAKPVDARADLFSLGAVLHELLTGRPLFKRDNVYLTMKAVLEEPIPAPSEINPRVPPELDALVLGALAREPERRYPSALAFLERLCLVANQLHLRQSRHELREVMRRSGGRGARNLATMTAPGIPLDGDDMTSILRGDRSLPALLRGERSGSGEGGPVSISEAPTQLEEVEFEEEIIHSGPLE